MRPMSGLSAVANTLICPIQRGLPNELGCYDELPEQTAALLKEWAEAGWVNIIGGCCGSTPAHITAMAKAVAGYSPRKIATPPRVTRLAGLEPMTLAA